MSESTVRIIRVDPLHRTTGVFFHLTLSRIKEFAERHFPETEPDFFTREVASKVATGDALLLALVTEKGQLVGHALATLEGYVGENGSGRQWVNGVQFKADTEAGEVLQRQTAQLIKEWGKTVKAQTALLMVRRSDIGWMKKDGWKPARVVVYSDLEKVGVDEP